ncbi:glucose sorbosone dehydrogenase [Acetobacterium bakii]|uniref:Glucose sorbosone dehydrogenase n=1 Tax=Acetobacterium bakii TaxID=52689 RepID=A0A0L6TYH8_9FIRM|nr:glucose sorbosone dehydrogenase [Acetobacterium bakii]
MLIMAVFLVGCTPVPNSSESLESDAPAATVADQTAPETICEKFQDGSIYDTPFQPLNYSLVPAYPNLSFEQPLYATGAGDNSNRIFVVERTGKIKVFPDNTAVEAAEVFLDLSDRIDTGGSEKGLLGLAFHPNFVENHYFYVNYTNENSSVIARYSLDPNNEGVADPSSEVVLLSFSQPYPNHNGGQLAFGPDGYLYIATGDGGSAGDPQNNAQNPGVLLGKILRIDVDQPQNDTPYGIPSDNPFYNNSEGYAPEIYALGLRNPWRFSFDPCRELLIAADVGQGKREEIDIIENGGNFGWNLMEGSLDYAPNPDVNKDTLTMPVWEYDRAQGQSITGGYVYYGNENPSLVGTYVYGDFGSGKIWGLWLDQNRSPHNYELLDTDLSISSFGLDDQNELLIVDYQGRLYKLSEAP